MKIIEIFKNFKPYKQEITKPYIIAEAGVNHEGSIEIAKRLINEAANAGANAIKFQTYKASTLASKDSPAYWDLTKEPTKSQFDLFSKHDKFWKKEMEELKKYCDEVDLEFMSTPFDMESAKFLNDLMDVYKISSSDITNKPFIEYICGFNKPVILSTGAANLIEIQEAVDWIEKYSNPLALLHCILNYPTLDENANLGMIKGLKKAFPKKIIGYSDHTLPKKMKTLEIATLLGAAILEKHFTHNKSLPGNDHYHAMDKNDLKVFCQNINEIFNLYGSVEVRSLKEEISSIKNARRSLVTSKLIKKGEIIKLEHLTFKRPASGISPKFIDQVLGKIAKEDISEDSILNWEMLET